VKKWLLKHPTYEEFVRLLMAWRVWVTGGVLGAIAAAIVYLFIPPQYRAQATVLVDQNAEQVIPQERSDLLIYTYLARETDKLVVLAWSDQVMSQLSNETGVTVANLRNGRLHLSQPSDGGWHFLADASDPHTAAMIASAWAKSFVDAVQSKPAGISTLLEVNITQGQDLPVRRSISMGVYVFCGSFLGVALLAFGVLFFDRKEV
jgi:capsular polysaccharide biosynthesis protein